MQYTYEVTETNGNIICNIFRDNFLLIYQPHHPQQNVAEDGEFWKNREDAVAWAENEIQYMNNPELFEAPVNAEPPAELPALSQEDLIFNIKSQLAAVSGVEIDQIKLGNEEE